MTRKAKEGGSLLLNITQMATEWVKTSHKRPVPWAKQWLMTRLNILLSSSCPTIELYSSCPCYLNQIVAINRSQLVWPQTSDVVLVRANVFGISKRWIPLNYQIISNWVSKEANFASYGWVWIYFRRKRWRDPAIYCFLSYRLILPNVPTSQEVSVKARGNQTQMWERKIKASSLTFI